MSYEVSQHTIHVTRKGKKRRHGGREDGKWIGQEEKRIVKAEKR
jgi:hypothetical protein